MNPFAACGIEAGAFGDLLAPVMTDLGPLLDRLKAVVAEFEPRIRASWAGVGSTSPSPSSWTRAVPAPMKLATLGVMPRCSRKFR